MADVPQPLRLVVGVSVMVHCSICNATAGIVGLPIEMLTIDEPPTIDRRALAGALPQDWKVGAMKPLGMGLVLKGGPPLDAKPMPVAFCPDCARGAGA